MFPISQCLCDPMLSNFRLSMSSQVLDSLSRLHLRDHAGATSVSYAFWPHVQFNGRSMGRARTCYSYLTVSDTMRVNYQLCVWTNIACVHRCVTKIRIADNCPDLISTHYITQMRKNRNHTHTSITLSLKQCWLRHGYSDGSSRCSKLE